MIGISITLHLIVFALMVFLPGFNSFNTRVLPGMIYQVDLVTLSAWNGQKEKGGQAGFDKNKVSEAVFKPDLSAKRVLEGKAREEEPIKIAKLTTIMKSEKEHDASSAELIKEAITKIEKETRVAKQAKQEEDRQIEEAIAGLKSQVKAIPNTGGTQAGQGTTGSSVGTPMTDSLAEQIYRAEVMELIRSKWSYPVELQKNLEAIVELSVRADGLVEKTTFVKRSGNSVFDVLVLKAIERAKPLPPFPEGLRKSNEEIEINFNLKNVN